MLVVTSENMQSSMIKFVSESLGYRMRIHPGQDGVDEAIVEFVADRPCMPSGLVMPVDDVRVLMLRPLGVSSIGAYLAIGVGQIEEVEKALFGVLRDHAIITVLTNIAFKNEAGEQVIQTSTSFSTTSARMQAMWLDFNDYMRKLQDNDQVTSVVVPAASAEPESESSPAA